MNPPEIDPAWITFEYFRSSGPGGQNVNKVSTAVRLRFDVQQSGLPEEVRQRLMRLAGKRMTESGFLIIEAQRYRTQETNQQDALDRLRALIARAWQPPKKRKPTKPGKGAIEKRLQAKKRRGQTKRQRSQKIDLE